MSNTRKTTTARKARLDAKDVFDLDALDRPERPKPFRFNLGGTEFTLADPIDLPYAEVAALGASTAAQLENGTWRQLLGDQYADWRAAVMEQGVELWRMEALLGAFQEHYKLPTPGEADASPLS